MAESTSTNLFRDDRWPALPLADWVDTRDTLQLWTQIIGKLKVELQPFLNQLWHTALHPTARGLTTLAMPFRDGDLQVDFDFVDHNLIILTSRGGRKVVPLYPRSVASFYEETMACLASLGVGVKIYTMPQELADPIPFDQDTVHASYDAAAVNRFWRILGSSARVMWRHKSRFIGKASPVHFFWGSFDLATTRHNGEEAELPPGCNFIYRCAENEANWCAGFWPGSGPVDYPAYFAYMVPCPERLAEATLQPAQARWSPEMKEFLLPYDAVRTAEDPERALMEFLQSSYEVSADLAGWDRASLEIQEIPSPPARRRYAKAS